MKILGREGVVANQGFCEGKKRLLLPTAAAHEFLPQSILMRASSQGLTRNPKFRGLPFVNGNWIQNLKRRRSWEVTRGSQTAKVNSYLDLCNPFTS